VLGLQALKSKLVYQKEALQACRGAVSRPIYRLLPVRINRLHIHLVQLEVKLALLEWQHSYRKTKEPSIRQETPGLLPLPHKRQGLEKAGARVLAQPDENR
jgi:hypothetical protein